MNITIQKGCFQYRTSKSSHILMGKKGAEDAQLNISYISLRMGLFSLLQMRSIPTSRSWVCNITKRTNRHAPSASRPSTEAVPRFMRPLVSPWLSAVMASCGVCVLLMCVPVLPKETDLLRVKTRKVSSE